MVGELLRVIGGMSGVAVKVGSLLWREGHDRLLAISTEVTNQRQELGSEELVVRTARTAADMAEMARSIASR